MIQKFPTIFKKAAIFVMLSVAKISILVNSESTGLRTSNFRGYGHFYFVGGSCNLVPAANKFKCIMDCASKTSCQGFTYDGVSCLHVDRSVVSSLAFSADPENVRIRRNVLLLNFDFDQVSLYVEQTMNLVNKLSIGDMIYLKAILLKHEDVCIEVYDTLGKENVTYHVRAKCADLACNDRVVLINNKFNNNWNDTLYWGHTYTLQINEVFEVHALITANGIITYLNGVFQFNLNTQMSVLTANYVKLYGYMKVLEFSF